MIDWPIARYALFSLVILLVFESSFTKVNRKSIILFAHLAWCLIISCALILIVINGTYTYILLPFCLTMMMVHNRDHPKFWEMLNRTHTIKVYLNGFQTILPFIYVPTFKIFSCFLTLIFISEIHETSFLFLFELAIAIIILKPFKCSVQVCCSCVF